jgi:ribosomal protein S18 acetylase RimI-like enzyme
MVTVRETMMEEWQVLKDIRLEALRDAPDAFGSTDETYQEQKALDEAHWRRITAQGGMFLAYAPEVSATEPAGLVRGYQEKPDTVQLMSLWVRPKARGNGVGEALVAAVIEWAIARNAATVHLWVFDTNGYARLLYERCGFEPTGERQPFPANPRFTEIGMAYPL